MRIHSGIVRLENVYLEKVENYEFISDKLHQKISRVLQFSTTLTACRYSN